MFPAVLLGKLLKNVLPQNRDTNQKVGFKNQRTNPEEREFSGKGDGGSPDAASLHISQLKVEKEDKVLQE